jgi:tetratricopeptide (TPR) repeat protein
MSFAGRVFDTPADTHVPIDRPDGKMSAMGGFFSDSNNGPWIFLLILVVDIAVVLGGAYLVMRTRARRVARRSAVILRRVRDEDRDGARTLLADWDRGERPKGLFARLSIAEAWSMVGDHQRALSILDTTKLPKGRLGRPFRRIASVLRYRALKGLGEDDRAEWFLRDAATDDPSAPWLVSAMSGGAAREDTREPWESMVRNARVRWSPKDAMAIAALIQEALRERRFDETVRLSERFLARAARSPTARLMLPEAYLAHGGALLAARRDDEAEIAFETFRGGSSDQSVAEQQVGKVRGEMLLYTGRISEAASAYETVVASREGPDAFAGLAMCRVRLGDLQGASDALDRAEALGFEADKALPIRAQIMVDQGMAREAEDLALRATGGDPTTNDPGSLYTLAYVRATARLPGAEETLRRYAELQPHDPDLGPLLDRSAPDGRTWRQRLEVAPRPDIGTDP